MISRLGKLIQGPGTYKVYVNKADPDGYVRIKIVFSARNDVIKGLFGGTVLETVSYWLVQMSLKIFNYALPLANFYLWQFGLGHYAIESVEVVDIDTDEPKIVVTARTDINPILAFAIGLVAGAIVAAIVSGVIKEIVRTAAQVEIVKTITSMYEQYYSLVRSIMEICKNHPNPDKCINDVLSQIPQPTTAATAAAEAVKSMESEKEKYKSYAYIATVAAVVLGIALLTRR
jgi:hypothetical protein